MRYICAGYYPQHIDFGGLTANIYSTDGRVLPKPVQAKSIDACSVERYDCIFNLDTPGVFDVTIDILHWVTGDVLGTARTRITVL